MTVGIRAGSQNVDSVGIVGFIPALKGGIPSLQEDG